LSEPRAEPDSEGLRTLRIQLTVRQLLLLQRLRYTRGQSAGEVIRSALDRYFDGTTGGPGGVSASGPKSSNGPASSAEGVVAANPEGKSPTGGA
jgi:hypothetical protein